MGSSQSTAANPEQSLEERKLQLQEKKFEYQQQADRASAKLKEREIQLAEAQSEAQKTTQKIYSENVIYWDYLATHWGLSTPSEQLVCAWRVTFTTNPAQLKKLAKSLSLRIEDLPKPLDPIAVNRFIRIHMVPGARWAAVPVLAVWYLVRSRDAQLAYSKSKYNSKL